VSVTALSATLALAAAIFGAGSAAAQGWGPAVAVKDVDPVIRAAAEVMGMVRTRALVIGQVNLPEYVGKGTMVDLEAATPGQPVDVSRYTYSVAIQVPASRLDFEGPQMPRTIRVVKGARAWNEEWSQDKTKLNTSPSDKASLRAQMMWLQPITFLHAAAFASAKKCLDGKPCTTPVKISTENGKSVIELDLNGRSYKATMGADKRPEQIQTMVTLAGGAAKPMVAIFTDYRTGEKPDGGFGTSYGDALDRFHSGTYWPSHIVHEIEGNKVLDIVLTDGWANPYVIFPEPELLAKAQ
jgi:hypothetical protein